nr:reverse transcriptase domain-containing protein [Tanacetum cinerariifolium]
MITSSIRVLSLLTWSVLEVKDSVVILPTVDEHVVASRNNKGTEDGNVGQGVTPITTTATQLSVQSLLSTIVSFNSASALSSIIALRAMIELRADVELKDTIVVVMPKLVSEGFNMCTILVEPVSTKNGASTSGKRRKLKCLDKRRTAKAKKNDPKEPPKEWTVEEEIALCQARCDVSKNNVVGNSMKTKEFWNAVITYFEKENGSSNIEMPSFYNNAKGRKKSKTSETTSGSASGGFNLNDEADELVEETQKVRPMGRDRSKAKKKSSASSRLSSMSVSLIKDSCASPGAKKSMPSSISPPIPLILGRCFLKTGRALIDVHKGELTLRIENEAIAYNLDQTLRYSANYDQITANKIDVTNETCEEYFQEVIGFSNVTASGSPTPSEDPIVSTTSPTLTPFGDSDFLLFEEVNAFLDLEDDPDSSKLDPSYCDPEGGIQMLEAILNSDPTPSLPNHEQFVPSFTNELKACETKTIKSFVVEPPEVELKDLPPHLEYAFLEGDNKFPVIIAKELGEEEKAALIKILMEEDYKPTVQHQRRVNPKIHDVIKKEVEKLLDAGLIYPIFDSPWVSPVHCVPKKGNEYYCFLDGFSGYFQIPIDPRDQEKTTFTCPYGTFAYRRMPFGLCNAPGTFQRCMLAIFHCMVEKMMEVFMDEFSVFGNSFETCLSRLDKMFQRCEDTKLCLNWEKSHFMVKEGIVLGHKISRNGIEVDKAKVDDTPFIFSEDYIKAFQTLKQKLTEAPILIAPNWDCHLNLCVTQAISPWCSLGATL